MRNFDVHVPSHVATEESARHSWQHYGELPLRTNLEKQIHDRQGRGDRKEFIQPSSDPALLHD